MPSWKKLIQSGSDAHLSKVTASALRVSSIAFDDGTMSSAQIGGGFIPTGSISATTADLEVTGTLKVNTSDTSNTAIFTNNLQNGYPTSNAWGTNLEGSFFNNFNNTTHVSEILRFMAGVLSSSLDVADAQPNTRFYFQPNVDESNTTISYTANLGYVPSNFENINNSVYNYLDLKGFVTDGRELFYGHDTSPMTATNYMIEFDSDSNGSTEFSSDGSTGVSSVGLFGLGKLASGAPNPIKVRISATQSFSDVATNETPDISDNTFTTQSELILSQDTFETSNGITLAKIETSQPAVIPAAFQDGKFVDIGGDDMPGTLTRNYPSAGNTSISSSGYYSWQGMKVGIASGSSGYDTKNSDDTTITHFYAPFSQISNDLGVNEINTGSVATPSVLTRLTAVSRSLSGAPYIRTATWKIESIVHGLFNPMYDRTATLVSTTIADDTMSITTTAGSSPNISTEYTSNRARVNTSNAIYTTAGVVRSVGNTPNYNDIAKHTASLDSNFGSSGTSNVDEDRTLSDSTFSTTIKATNREGTETTLYDVDIAYHEAGTFEQPVASSSLAVFGAPQNYQASTISVSKTSDAVEVFKCEQQRIKLNDNLLSGNGDSFDTGFNVANTGDFTGLLSKKDLQVKPGYLVDPFGQYGYWYPYDDSGDTFQYYIRKYQLTGDNPTTMELSIFKGASRQALVNWNGSTTGTAVAILYESSTTGELSTARLFDPSELNDGVLTTLGAGTTFNPFGQSIDLYGMAGGGSVSNSKYTFNLLSGNKMIVNSTYNNFWVIVRMKSDYITKLTVGLG